MPVSNNATAGMGNSSTKSNNAFAAPTIISGSNPTPTPSSGDLLAQFDFSQIPDQNLKVDGDYTIPVTGGSTSATTATIKAVKCAAGIGANGIQRIKSGKLEFLPDIITP